MYCFLVTNKVYYSIDVFKGVNMAENKNKKISYASVEKSIMNHINEGNAEKPVQVIKRLEQDLEKFNKTKTKDKELSL